MEFLENFFAFCSPLRHSNLMQIGSSYFYPPNYLSLHFEYISVFAEKTCVSTEKD